MLRRAALLLLLVTPACDDGAPASDPPDATAPDASPDPDAAPDPDAGPSPADPRYRTTLATPADYADLQAATGGEVKFLLPVAGRPARPPLTDACYFQDMRRFEWHLQFLRSFAEFADLSTTAYEQLVLRAATRAWWAGAAQLWPAVPHPAGDRLGVVTYTLYSANAPGEDLTVDQIAEVDATLKGCAPFARDLLVFVPTDPRQQQMARAQRATLAARGVATLFPEDLVRGLPSIAYSPGEGYGYLNVVPAGQRLEDYGPRDVVVVRTAPNDISLVAGLVTADPQNLHSHVNLRLREKGVPNAAVPLVYDSELVRALEGALVHLVVEEARVTLEPARLEDAEAFWAAHRPHVGEPRADLSVTAIARFADLHAADAVAYGAKAANLAELWHVLPSAHRTEGFAVPFAASRDFLAAHGLEARIATLLADPRLRTDRAWKRAALDDLRDRIEDAPLPASFLETLAGHIGDPTRKMRFRSSTNAEDLDELSGAGLYDSKSGCLADDLDGDEDGPSRCLADADAALLRTRLAEKRAELAAHPERDWLRDVIDEIEDDLTDEKPVAKAVRKVWASLWNERAFDEREFYGIDHGKVFMGLAVNPAFVEERASAVVVTNLAPDAGLPLYRVVSQAGEESVVRPVDPTAVPEVLTFRRDGDALADPRVLVASSLAPDGIWSEGDLGLLASLLFSVQDHFEAEVYPNVRPLRLDLEVKIERDGRVTLKQVRPYVNLEP